MVNDVCEEITRDTVEVLQRAQLMARFIFRLHLNGDILLSQVVN